MKAVLKTMKAIPKPLLSCFAVILWLSPIFANDRPPSNRPNIIVIVADDLGYNDLSCMGQTFFTTPNLDKMASEGMRMTQFYAGCTVCAPSRACLLTGQHTGHVYQRFNGPVQFREDPLDLTIATRLQSVGYRTAMIGKSGLSCNSDDLDLPHRKGFDHFCGFVSHGAAHRYYPPSLVKNGEQLKYKNNHGKEGETYSGDVFLQETLAWINDNQSEPFFLHLALQQPHADLQVPAAYREKFIGRYDETPNKDGHYRGETHPKATFVGMIDYLDQSVGQILDELRRLKIDKNTLVLFTSDNGPHFEGGHSPDALDSNGIYRGGKRDLYEGGIRVPLIAWWPGTIAPGQTSDHLSAFWDIPATACELADLPIPEDFDGISFVPTLLKDQASQKQHDYLYWEFYERGGKQAVRSGDWKAIRLNVSASPDGPLELYHLSHDPTESTDVADKHPEVVKRMASLMAEAHTPSESITFRDGPTKKKKENEGSARKNPTKARGNRIQTGWIDRSEWKVVQCSSQSASNARTIEMILDDAPRTHWHSNYKDASSSHPHWFVIDLGRSYNLAGAGFLCRQDGQLNGAFEKVTILVSETPQFSSDGFSAQLDESLDEQFVEFTARGRYVKVIAESEINGMRYASLAEFNLRAQ